MSPLPWICNEREKTLEAVAAGEEDEQEDDVSMESSAMVFPCSLLLNEAWNKTKTKAESITSKKITVEMKGGKEASFLLRRGKS